MKIGKVEGTPQEIKDYVDLSGFNLADVLEIKKEIRIYWVLIPIVLFVTVSSLIWIFNGECGDWGKVLRIVDLFLIFWIATAIHLKYKIVLVTALSLLFPLLVLGICCELITLRDAIQKIIEKIK